MENPASWRQDVDFLDPKRSITVNFRSSRQLESWVPFVYIRATLVTGKYKMLYTCASVFKVRTS
jgi:hypothetical protein